jgi:superfamily II DNA/RNA helicase
VNYECPDDEKTYVHRIGRTGRAGKAGVAVTFVDWRDMHRWKLINDALDLGKPEPEETYSTSEHLYAQLDIPREATGTLPRAMRERVGLEAEAIEDIGETGRIRTPRRGREGSAGRSAGRAAAGRGGAGRGADQPRKGTRDAGDAAVQAGGDRARRRRRTRSGRDLGGSREAAGENRPEETRRKAS